MNSLEIIKQQLIRQKDVLQQKGINVTVSNKNPSPSDITTALENLNLDFSAATATEFDVKKGKTFYAQNNELKTGALESGELDALYDKINLLISGVGSMEIEIPHNITRIRKYLFHIDTATGQSADLFYCNNLTIPPNIEYIGERAFCNAKITGVLTIPETCTKVSSHAFNGVFITEAYIYGGFTSASLYALGYNTNLKKVVLGDNITAIANYLFSGCSYLNELILPANSLFTVTSSAFSYCSNLKFLKFTGENPPKFQSNSFSYINSTLLLVPYASYDQYINATNFLSYGNPVCCYGEFLSGNSLPQTIDNYSIVWYKSTDDAKSNTNPITVADTDGTYYSILTEITSEE